MPTPKFDTRFRRAGTCRDDFSNSEELRSTLQRRLRGVAWVSVAYNIACVVVGTLSPIVRALAKDPTARFENARRMASALETLAV